MKPTNPVQASGLKRLLLGLPPHGMTWPDYGASAPGQISPYLEPAWVNMLWCRRILVPARLRIGGRPQRYKWLATPLGVELHPSIPMVHEPMVGAVTTYRRKFDACFSANVECLNTWVNRACSEIEIGKITPHRADKKVAKLSLSQEFLKAHMGP